MDVRVKICGLKTPRAVAAAVEAGAAYLGFNFYPGSPRSVTPETARALALEVPAGVAKVALVVDAEDEDLAAILDLVPIDMLQLHGRETPDRVAEVRARFGLPVMKAVGVASHNDMSQVTAQEEAADQILVDAKAAPGAVLPGGNGLTFDWRALEGHDWRKPWMLAGGLTSLNAAEAVRRTGARQIDVASGVERGPGEKDEDLIRAFLDAVR